MDVLFIEDDPECRVSIMGIFSEYLPDFNVTVDSGFECIHVIINRNPDLVVLSLDILGLDVMKMIEKRGFFQMFRLLCYQLRGVLN